MAKTLIPSEFKTHIIEQVIESVTEVANTVYYAFIGDHIASGATEDEVNQPVQNYNTIQIQTYRNMLIGKRMGSDDLKFMVPRYDWESGKVFEMYDDTVTNLLDKNFFVVVDENAYKHVYKCLYNANNAVSTAKPLFKDAQYDAALYEAGDAYYETTDGYQWKYMYSIDSRTFTKFATQKYIPVVANTTIESNASEGSLDVIRVTSHGKNYRNSKSGQFIEEDFNRITNTIAQQAGIADPTLWYRVREASQVENFYANTVMYLTSGTGSGEYRSIVQSKYVTGVGVVLKVENQWTLAPDDTSTYEISPEVRITGNGNESVKAIARAIINTAASDSIHKIEMLENGSGYTYAAADVLIGAPADENLEQSGVLIETTPAELRPIISPQGGHGANTAVELGASHIAMYMKFNRDETGLIASENTFGQFGIVRDPLFANVEIYFTNTSGTFIEGETVEQFIPFQMNGTFNANTSLGDGKFVQRSDGLEDNYLDYLTVGDKIYIKDADNTAQVFITEVAVGSNTTAISLKDEIPFLVDNFDFAVQVFNSKTIATAKITNINPPVATPGATAFLCDKVEPNFVVGEVIYGHTSRVTADVSGIDINNRINSSTAAFNFSDYNQMLKIQGTTTDTFEANEKVRQVPFNTAAIQGASPIDATGFIHSWTSDQLNLTRVEGDFQTAGNEITGDSSGSVFEKVPGDLLDVTYGDLDPNEGSIIYIQNDIPVSREQNQSEEIRVILEF